VNLQPRQQEEPTVDLTSLIDVVFLLLIFFMVSTTFERQAILKVELPEASEVQEESQTPESLELVIDGAGVMYLNNQRLTDSTPQTIRAAMLEQAGDDTSIPLVLRADRQTPHHFVVTVMDVSAQLGFTNLSIATNRSDGDGQ
jgi:biopolymer transport protein ExbD